MRSRKSMCVRRPLRLRPLRCGKMCVVTCAHRWPVLTSYYVVERCEMMCCTTYRYLFFYGKVRFVGVVGDTQPRECYAALPRYCMNYALQAFYARRNRRNSPSMARFLLALPSMAGHFCVSMHNSTATKQLRYALSRECTRHLRRQAAFAHASHISWLQYYATSGNIKIFKIRKIKMPESGESNADLRPHKNRRSTLQMPV